MGDTTKPSASEGKTIEYPSPPTSPSEDATKSTTTTKDPYTIDDVDSLLEEGRKTKLWSELSRNEKTLRVIKTIAKISLVFILLYFFICTLDLLSVGFRILGGHTPERIFDKNNAINNPVIGLMCGILFTIIVQSSSTTTSAVVGLVAGEIITVKVAIPIIMGANIGTSVTNTLLAMVQVGDRDRFRRAFAGATIHDMFNWLTTLVLLPIECLTGYLYVVTSYFVSNIHREENSLKRKKKLKLLKALTEPLTKKIVKFNKKALEPPNRTLSLVDKEDTMFAGSPLSDTSVGIVIVVLSFAVLLLVLFCIVKVLKSILQGKMAVWIRRTSNSNLPFCPWLTDYLLILLGAFLTFMVQSSSVFTSTLSPLVAVKAISIARAYPLVLGANLGTTTTAIIAAMTQEKNISLGLQIALCHFLFNLTGVLLFFPLPCTRFPIGLAKSLGNTTAKYRWFAIVYVVALFVLLPLLFMGLAFAGSIYVIVVASTMFIILLFIVIINSLRRYPRCLPKVFHSWNWLPECMRSLEPYDRVFMKLSCCRRLKSKTVSLDSPDIDQEKESEVETIKSVPTGNTDGITVASEEDDPQLVDSTVTDTKTKRLK